MKSPIDSRARFVETAAALLRRQGYHATGLAQVVEESGAPKGSLYFHFPGGKEELATAAIERSAAELHAELAAMVGAARSPAAAVRAVASALADELEASRFQDGCPVATVALEAAAQVPALQAVCSAAYGRWQALIEGYLASAGVPAERARSLGNLVLAAIEGALLLSRAHADTTPLRRVGDELGRLVQAQLDAPPAGVKGRRERARPSPSPTGSSRSRRAR